MEDIYRAEHLQTFGRREFCEARDAVSGGFLGGCCVCAAWAREPPRKFHGLDGNGAWSPSVVLTACKRLGGVNFAMHEIR